jgi:hypothetical protein
MAARDISSKGNEIVGIAGEAGKVGKLLGVDNLGHLLGLGVDLCAALANHLHFSGRLAD